MKNNMNFDNDFPDFEQFTSSFNNNVTSTRENNFNNNNSENDFFSNIDMNTIFKIKQIMDGINNNKNNPRTNLLLSLKPYLKPSRKQKVDQYIQFLNMSTLIENLKPMGGENKK